ncbi:retrovirus-related pol polyprotein from transposon TNT 1-94 [Tanacetum coccineum]
MKPNAPLGVIVQRGGGDGYDDGDEACLRNSKNSAKKVAVYVRKNKQTDDTSANVISNKENVIDVNVANASKAKTLLCVSCMQNVVIPCHDKLVQIVPWIVDTCCSKLMTVRKLEGDDLPTGGTRNSNLYKSPFSDMAASSPVCLMSNATSTKSCKMGGCERRNRTLIEAARTMLIFSRLPEFLWAEAVATTCFTQNRSIIHTRHNKTPYELLRGRKPNVEYFHVFGSLCYPTNDRDDLGKMKPKADIGVFIGYSETSRGSLNTPSKEDLDNLFGPMFEEYFKKRSSNTPINSAAQPTQFHEDSPSTSSIIIEDHEAPSIETTSDEQTSPLSLTKADEFIQEDYADFDGSLEFVSYNPPSDEEIESSIAALEPSNVQVEKALYGLKQDLVLGYDKLSFCPKFNMGSLKFFLVLQVHQSPRGIFISQSQYAIELLKKHGLDECVSMSTPMATERLDADLQGTPTNQTTYRRMIGGLMYLTASRPDIAYATFVCARYQARPTVKHLKEVKNGFFSKVSKGGLGLERVCEKLMSWSSKKQDRTAMSTAEAEYVSLSACCAQVIWMRTQLLDYGYKYFWIPMYCDSKSAIAISCNPIQHSKTKHIDIRYHFIKEHVEKGTAELYFVGTQYQLADLFTKALPKERFAYLVHRIVIIMAQQQHAVDVHPDELCPPNKRYDPMDANKKIDFEQKTDSSIDFMFMLDQKELSLTLDDFRTIFHLPQATDNNHESFVPPHSFLSMVPFYKIELVDNGAEDIIKL